MKLLSTIAFFVIFIHSLFSQTNNCSLDAYPVSYKNYMMNTADVANNYDISANRSEVRDVALNIIIAQYSTGSVVTPQSVQIDIDQMNIIFAPINLHFSICNIQFVPYPYNLTNSPGFETWDNNIENYFTNAAWQNGYLNIFYAKGGVVNSALPFLGASDRILMGNNPTTILAHEIAHYFSLLHTHAFNGYSTNIYTLELVNGSNCQTEGDFICDTPADPGLFGRIAPFPQCEYIDSVSVDANGDLYAPAVDNYMCATYPNCITQFTPQQFSRMAYCLDHERAYLKSGNLGVSMDSIPRKLCITSDPIVLNSPSLGGTFSGNGVVNGTFFPEIAGPGNHVITYTATTSESAIETTDAFYNYRDTTYFQNSSWQSFTLTETGTFSGFAFSMIHPIAQVIDYKIYSGNGISGALLAQGTVSASINSNLDWFKIIFTNPLTVNQGNIFTVKIDAANNYQIAGMRSNQYPFGISNMNNDLSFISYIIPLTPNCGNTTYSNITIGVETPTFADILFPSYCLSAPVSEVSFIPAGGTIQIDNQNSNIIDPVALGSGLHTANYTFQNNFGCITNNNNTFEIPVSAQISLPDAAVFCRNDSLLDFTLTPLEGNLYLDNQPLSIVPIDLSQLEFGTHTLTYAKTEEYIWFDTINQSWAPATNFSVFEIGNNDTLWQSFIPSSNGYIDKFNLGLYSNYLVPVSYKLFKGTGTSGEELYAAVDTFGTLSTFLQYFDFPDFQLLLNKDSVYTFAIYFENALESTVNAGFENTYPRGVSSYAYPALDIDFRFEYVMNPFYTCVSDSIIKEFSIVNDFSVDLGPDQFITSGQSITLNAGNANNSYLWSTGDTTQTLTINNEPENGLVWVTVFNEFGCAASDTISIILVTDFNQISTSNFEIQLFPNPVEDYLTVQSSQPITSLEIINMVGQIVYKTATLNKSESELTFPTSNLSSGIYNLRVNNKIGNASKKFVKAN
jgi:hypothetical protein